MGLESKLSPYSARAALLRMQTDHMESYQCEEGCFGMCRSAVTGYYGHNLPFGGKTLWDW